MGGSCSEAVVSLKRELRGVGRRQAGRVGASGGLAGAGLRGCYPVFQRQVGQAGEVAGVARDEGEAVGRRRAADENIKIIYQPAIAP